MTCELERPESAADALVLLGATGDLAFKKIYPALQALLKRGALQGIPIIGVARQGWELDRLRAYVRKSLEQRGILDEAAFAALSEQLRYVGGDYRDPETFTRLKEALGPARRPLYYLAIPPSLFAMVIAGLEQIGSGRGRVVVEKPFGRDLASARVLNRVLSSVFPESAIFRIDHYLGKESVQNLMYFRFGNTFPEPIWNRNYVQSVQITMAERFGVDGRGPFYEEVGALRDVVQNHLLQVLATVAMEPPIGDGTEAVRDEKAKVFRGLRTLDNDNLVRGQYRGYRDEPGVHPESPIETFAAARLYLDSWRWEGVPFYVRAGKNLPLTATEVLVELKRPPQQLFEPAWVGAANYFRFRLGPDNVSIALGARAKRPGPLMVGDNIELCFCDRNEGVGDYERLIGDALVGDQTLFARQDCVEEAWRIVEPVLGQVTPPFEYLPGTWGPMQASAMIDRLGGWHSPRRLAIPTPTPIPDGLSLSDR